MCVSEEGTLKIRGFIVLCLLSAVSIANAGTVVKGDLHIQDGGDLVFSDGSVQSKAQVQGATGPQGPQGPQGAAGQVTLASICNAISAANMSPPSFCSAYSNATFTGTWMVGGTSYFIGDGSGVVTHHSFYNEPSPAGSYIVQSNGAFILNIIDAGTHGGTYAFTGALTSSTTGTINYSGQSGPLVKVSNIAAVQGGWRGTLSDTVNSRSIPITFQVGADGSVSSFTGFTGPVSGYMFSEAGTTVAYFKTGASDQYSQFNILGTLSGSSVIGFFKNATGGSTIIGTITLTKQLE
jgi:hypothetical protein